MGTIRSPIFAAIFVKVIQPPFIFSDSTTIFLESNPNHDEYGYKTYKKKDKHTHVSCLGHILYVDEIRHLTQLPILKKSELGNYITAPESAHTENFRHPLGVVPLALAVEQSRVRSSPDGRGGKIRFFPLKAS